MLAKMEMPMIRSLQFALCMTRRGRLFASLPGISCILLLAFLVCCGSVSLLHAQNSAPAPSADQTALPALPAAPSPAPAASNPFLTPAAPVPALDSAPSAFGQDQNQPQPPVSSGNAGMHSGRGTRSQGDGSMMDPFQPSPNFGNYAGSASSGIGFNGGGAGFGGGRQSLGGFNQMGGSAMGGRQGNFPPLFPATDGPTRSAGGPFGTAPVELPSLNQLMRGSFNLPFSSSSSSFRFSYMDALRPGGALSDVGHPTASAMFTTSDLGNGVFLSAGTGYGTRSTAGASAAGIGTGPAGDHKQSGPSVNLKLSF